MNHLGQGRLHPDLVNNRMEIRINLCIVIVWVMLAKSTYSTWFTSVTRWFILVHLYHSTDKQTCIYIYISILPYGK